MDSLDITISLSSCREVDVSKLFKSFLLNVCVSCGRLYYVYYVLSHFSMVDFNVFLSGHLSHKLVNRTGHLSMRALYGLFL